MSYWVAVSALGLLGLYWLYSAIRDIWHNRKAGKAWWKRTDGDYIDLRPREVPRRHWR